MLKIETVNKINKETTMKRTADSKALKKSFTDLAKRLLIFALLCGVFLLSAFYIPQNVTYEYKTASASEKVRETAEPQDTLPASETLRILRLDNGRVGVFHPDGSLDRWLDFPKECLTAYDLELLEGGISVAPEELAAFLEEAEY